MKRELQKVSADGHLDISGKKFFPYRYDFNNCFARPDTLLKIYSMTSTSVNGNRLITN